ncbi:MAG: Flp pilus assembly protein CpaB [Anaerovibrio sp.]|uniref:Flp pilus assembly protein CpaB n=1 Tax=Anaerovibrio sp. TaxID=1872532 RepID=UPI0025D829C5|nr:Flp pilus assembly protein CpaB [Anaerovibrio sp.]MCR5177117.1 Flp pilus assembly protein CpaB [Anaerovibrio sp.]
MKSSFFQNISSFIENINYRYWIIASAIVSLLLGLMVFLYLGSDSSSTKQNDNRETIQVIAAAQDIPPRTLIQSNMVKSVAVPKDLVPDGAITNASEIVGKPAENQIYKDDIITAKKVLMDIKMAGFTGWIPPDCRAVSIAINDVTGVAGFARPGDYVDIMVITGSNNDKRVSSNIILQNVLLLAINKTPLSEGDNNKGAAQNGDTGKNTPPGNTGGGISAIQAPATATLAVTPKDALKLLTNANAGTLYLVLRPYKPRNTFSAFTEYSKLNNHTAPQASAPVKPVQPQPSYTPPAPSIPAEQPKPAKTYGNIEIIRGTTVTREGN